MASGAQGGGNGWDLLRHSAPETDRKTRWFSNRRSKSEKQRSFAGTARRRPGTDETYFNAFIVTLHEIGEAYTFPLTERCRSYERLELSVPGDLPGEAVTAMEGCEHRPYNWRRYLVLETYVFALARRVATRSRACKAGTYTHEAGSSRCVSVSEVWR